MEIWAVLPAAFAGTTLMTLFSHVCGRVSGNNFNEPSLLNELLETSRSRMTPSSGNEVWGWLIHYGIGLIMALWIWAMYHFSGWGRALYVGFGLGLLGGVIGLIGWYFLFLIHRDPPETNLKGFAIQLLAAHVIFGGTAYVVFRWWG